jgi:hypothetical protein
MPKRDHVTASEWLLAFAWACALLIVATWLFSDTPSY